MEEKFFYFLHISFNKNILQGYTQNLQILPIDEMIILTKYHNPREINQGFSTYSQVLVQPQILGPFISIIALEAIMTLVLKTLVWKLDASKMEYFIKPCLLTFLTFKLIWTEIIHDKIS